MLLGGGGDSVFEVKGVIEDLGGGCLLFHVFLDFFAVSR